jgi:toxin ParE1/3/4
VVPRRRWRVRLSQTAERDFLDIFRWTAESFGRRQALIYRRTLIEALTALHSGPELSGSMPRDEIRPGLRSVHVGRQGRRGRRIVLYRSDQAGTVEVVRILHDAMDLQRHLTSGEPAP